MTYDFEQTCNRIFVGFLGTLSAYSLPDIASACAGFATTAFMIVSTYKALIKKEKKDE